MGQGGNITLSNKTPYDWNLTNIHEYQMNNWGFATIPAGQSASFYVEFNEAIFNVASDDGGDATFALSGTNYNFALQARASVVDEPGPRGPIPTTVFNLQVQFTGLEAAGYPQGSILNLGWNHDGNVTFTLSGEDGNFTVSNS